MKDHCTVDIVYKEPDRKHFFLNEDILGGFTIIPFEDLSIESLGYRLVLETRGKMKYAETILNTKTLMKDAELCANESYYFDFSVVNRVVGDYKGVNVRLSFRLEIWIKKAGKFYQKNPKGIIDKITNKLNFNNEITYGQYLIFKTKENSFAVHTRRGEMSYSYDILMPLLLFIVMMFLLFLFIPNAKEIFIVKVILGTLFATLIIGYGLILKSIGYLNARYKNLKENKFSFKVENSHNWKYINRVFANYEIREEVTDNRGTSSVTTTETIFASPEILNENPKDEIEFTFPFPEKYPASLHIGDTRILWVSIVTVKLLLGIQVTLKGEFLVERKFN